MLHVTTLRAALGVRANVEAKSSIPIGSKVKISPKGFALTNWFNLQSS